MSKSYYPPAGFYFKVFTQKGQQNGIDTAFQEVAGIAMSMKPYTLEEGGVNFMNRQLPGTTSYKNLELKRGLIPMDSDLAEWCFETMGNKQKKQVETKSITVQLLGEKATPVMAWLFHDAFPVEWNVAGFDAQKSGIIVESMSLTYTFFEIDNSFQIEEDYLAINRLFK